MAAKKTPDVGTKELQQKSDEVNEQGFQGKKVDPEDNYVYSVAGVTEHPRSEKNEEKNE